MLVRLAKTQDLVAKSPTTDITSGPLHTAPQSDLACVSQLASSESSSLPDQHHKRGCTYCSAAILATQSHLSRQTYGGSLAQSTAGTHINNVWRGPTHTQPLRYHIATPKIALVASCDVCRQCPTACFTTATALQYELAIADGARVFGPRVINPVPMGAMGWEQWDGSNAQLLLLQAVPC